jgi:amidase
VTRPGRKKLKVGLLLTGGSGKAPDAEVAAAINDTAKLMESMGHRMEPASWPIDSQQFGQDFLTYWAAGAAQVVEAVAKATGKTPDATMLEPFTLGMAGLVAGLKPGQLEAAIGRLEAASRAYDAWFARYDVVLSPVLSSPPVKLGYVSGDVKFEELSARLTDYVGYTPLHNVAGAAAMSVPLGWSPQGLPIGSHFAARLGKEEMLFELAYALEEAQPWAGRKPPVSV